MNKFIIASLLLVSVVSTAQQKVWSIQDCMEYAIKNNIQIQQQNLLTQDADLNIKDAKGAYLPNLSASANSTWNNTKALTYRNSDYYLSSTVPIFSGFQNKNTLQRRRLEKTANELTINAAKDDIRINIANSYLQILLQQENLALLKAQYDITKQQIEKGIL